MRVILLFLFLTISCFASEEYSAIKNDAQYHAMFYDRADVKDRIDLMRVWNKEDRLPRYGIQEISFKQSSEASLATNEFEKERAFVQYQKDLKEFSDKIENNNKFVAYYLLEVGSYNFGSQIFPVNSYKIVNSKGIPMKFDTRSLKNSHRELILDGRLKNYLDVKKEDAEKVFNAKTPMGDLRIKVFGEISSFSDSSINPQIRAHKWEILNSSGDVIFSHEMKTKKRNVYLILDNWDFVIIKYQHVEILRFDRSNRLMSLDDECEIDGVTKKTRDSDKRSEKMKKTRLSTGPQIIQMSWGLLTEGKFLIAHLPDTDENYELLARGDEKEIREAFKKYYKK